MAKNLQGGCLCGAVRYQITTGAGVEGSDLAGTYCHCSMCRRASGGRYAMLFDNPRSALSWTKGAPTIYQSSPVAKRGFRRACGSPLFYEGDTEAVRSMTAGSLDESSIFRPDHHYGIESRLPWANCGRNLPGRENKERFEGQPA